MEVANAAAFDAGAHSIGIPYFGAPYFGSGEEKKKGESGETLKGEERTTTERHTLTVPSQGYESRIPLLLYRRPLVVFVPGGSGTTQELAAALIDLSSRDSVQRKLVFVGKDYYRLLVEGMKSARLPEAFLSSVELTDSPSELKRYVEDLEKKTGSTLIRTLEKPVPRNSNQGFVPLKKTSK